MLPLKQIVPFILQAQLSLFISPLFWLLVLVVAYQYRRLARLKEELFGVRGESAWQPILTALAYGVLGGLGGSFIMVLVGVSLSGIGINYLWIVALLLMLINPRFLCFSYAGGLISLSALILGVPQVDVPHLMGLVAVLHMVEAFLIRVSGHLGAIPVYTSHQGRVVGAFNMQKFWPIPIAALALITLPPWLPPGAAVPMPDWWPLIRPAVMPEPEQALFVVLPVAAGLGYGDLALSSRPEEKSKFSARSLAIYSLSLLVLSILASYYRPLTWLAALFGPLGHEYTIWLGRRVEIKGEPIYVPSDLGARLLDVVRNSPAAKLGLRSGDILLKVNGYLVHDRESLKAALEGPYEQVEVVFYREGEGEKTATVYKRPLDPLGVILVPEPGDNPQVELISSGWLARWWREKRR